MAYTLYVGSLFSSFAHPYYICKNWNMKPQVEVCFSPELYRHKLVKENFVVVVTDIFRATTSICAALNYGVKAVIPVSNREDAKKYKEKGYIIACEQNGQTVDFADIGNSPSDFMKMDFRNKIIAFSTTNGTYAINLAKQDADEVFIGSFINLTALFKRLSAIGKNVVILCAAWKNLFNLEDSLFAGALSELLIDSGEFESECDSVKASIDLWRIAKLDLQGYLSKSSHRRRLKRLVSDDDYRFTLTLDASNLAPTLKNGEIIVADALQTAGR